MIGKEKWAVDQMIWTSTKPFESKYLKMIPTIENSNTGQFSIDSKAVGAYLRPVSIKLLDDKITPVQLQLARTDNVVEAKKAWEKLGPELDKATAPLRSKIGLYQFYIDHKPWPLWYLVYGSFMVPGVFLGGFAAFAGIGYLASRIRILRGEWLRLQRG